MIDYSNGLLYCGDDEDFYRVIMQDFADESEERLPLLEETLSTENWTAYEIAVHSLKATAKMIGANALSERARLHQAAAAAGDTVFLKSDFAALKQDYLDVIREIREI